MGTWIWVSYGTIKPCYAETMLEKVQYNDTEWSKSLHKNDNLIMFKLLHAMF